MEGNCGEKVSGDSGSCESQDLSNILHRMFFVFSNLRILG